MFACHRLLLAAPVLAATLCGCSGWDAWRQRVQEGPLLSAAADEMSPPSYRIEPDPSSPDVYNEDYDPYHGEVDPYASRTGKFAPPPAPPAQEGETTLNLDGQDSPAPTGKSRRRLIRTLRTPPIFSPDSVRSIYDRIRGSDSDPPTAEQIRREGPIAMRHIPFSTTHACSFSEAQQAVAGPVLLGTPETEHGPLRHSALPRLRGAGGEQPSVIQAGPSSYRLPMHAESAGVRE